MGDLGRFTQWLWACTAIVQIFLFGLLVVRRNINRFPAFSVYLFMTLAQSGLLFVTIRGWGFSSSMSWRVGWATQCLVLGARAFAVGELCHHVLGRFRGIWVLGRWILLLCGAAVLTYGLIAAKHQWQFVLNTLELGLELATAAVIVVLLLFARYYQIGVQPALRLLAIGLCGYSCVSVVNDAILERWLSQYVLLWNAFGMLAFFVCLLVWSWAFRKAAPQAMEATLLPDGSIYRNLVPEVNWRLRSLDQDLMQLWRLEAPRS